jgi:hypothetical protein
LLDRIHQALVAQPRLQSLAIATERYQLSKADAHHAQALVALPPAALDELPISIFDLLGSTDVGRCVESANELANFPFVVSTERALLKGHESIPVNFDNANQFRLHRTSYRTDCCKTAVKRCIR